MIMQLKSFQSTKSCVALDSLTTNYESFFTRLHLSGKIYEQSLPSCINSAVSHFHITNFKYGKWFQHHLQICKVLFKIVKVFM